MLTQTSFKQAPKRQRTSSPSPTAVSKQSNSISQPASDDESKAKATTNGAKKERAVSRNQRDKETKEPEEPESERPETANRRKARADRRKGEGEFSQAQSGINPLETNNSNDRVGSRSWFPRENRRTRSFPPQPWYASTSCSTRAGSFSSIHAQIGQATSAPWWSRRTQSIYTRSG